MYWNALIDSIYVAVIRIWNMCSSLILYFAEVKICMDLECCFVTEKGGWISGSEKCSHCRFFLYKSGEDMYEPAKSFRPLKKLDESPVPKNVSLSIPSFAEVMKMCTNLQGRFVRRRRWTNLRFWDRICPYLQWRPRLLPPRPIAVYLRFRLYLDRPLIISWTPPPSASDPWTLEVSYFTLTLSCVWRPKCPIQNERYWYSMWYRYQIGKIIVSKN